MTYTGVVAKQREEARALTVYRKPDHYPEYVGTMSKTDDGRRISVYVILDFAFIVAALLLSLWLAVLLLTSSMRLTLSALIPLSLCWVVVTYLFLPRLHQLFTFLYIPDYFIGRTRTRDGVLGDPINLAFDASEADIHAAMQASGWTLADPITVRSSWKIVISSVFRRSYRHAPVSDLLVFGRAQDFAYQQEVEGSASRRHHVRFWKVPEGWTLPGGHHVDWIAAGTFDRAVGLSVFTLQVTHKIDEDVDRERDYVVNTVLYSVPGAKVRVIEDFSSGYHHRNGGGDAIRTDGHLPVVNLNGAADRTKTLFSQVIQPPLTPARRKRIGDHQIPPKSLIFAGVVALCHIATIIGQWDGIVGSTSVFGTDVGQREALIVSIGFLVAVILEVVLWVLTLMRRRWARIALMTLASVVAWDALLGLAHERGSLTAVFLATYSVLVVLMVSGSATREWVGSDEKDPTFRLYSY